MKIATLGPKGSFSEEAVLKRYKMPETLFCSDVSQVLQSVIDEEVDQGILPYFNSSSGPVEQTKRVIDFELTGNSIALRDKRIVKVDEFLIPVRMNIIGLKGARTGDIEETLTHPKAAQQCSEYLRRSSAKLITSYYVNGEKVAYTTSEAARAVSEESANNIAAIASENVIKDYPNLEILVSGIQDDPNNRTYFFSFKKA